MSHGKRPSILFAKAIKSRENIPAEERYGLTAQLRRAAVSIPANIAEGQGRTSRKEFAHHLSIAHGSLRELETHVIIASRLGFLPLSEKQTLLNHAAEVGKLINGLLRSLKESN